jgi:integrase
VPRLPRGITKTDKGWRVSIRTRSGLFQKRFPASKTLEDIETALADARKKQKAGKAAALEGSLDADIARYLADHYKGRPGYAERERHLTIWKDELGAEMQRSDVTRDDIARVLNGWRASGLAADTCNKRRTALLALYHALDGRGGSNPVREIAKFRSPEPLARGLPFRLIERAFNGMQASKTKARLQVLAYTGIRPGQLMQLTPDHWDKTRRLLHVPGTAKGRGTKPYTLPLSPAATAALKAMDTESAWGKFQSAVMALVWKRAVKRSHLPKGTVPYDLRHSFGTAIYRATGDLLATKELLGHASMKMTERYTRAAVPARQKIALQKAFR